MKTLTVDDQKRIRLPDARPRQVFAYEPEADGTIRLGPNGTPVTAEQLKEQLTAQAVQKPDLRLAINADKNAPWGQIVKVMDAAKETGIKAVNAFTKTTVK